LKKILDAFGTFGPAIRAAFTGDVFKFVGELEKLLMKLATIVEKIPMVGKDAAESIRAGAKGIGKMGEEFRKIEEQAANKNKQREPKPTGPSFIDQMLAKKREEEAKKLEENRKALFALTKKPFWLTATVEDFRKVNEDILKKAKIALEGQKIGPLKDLKIGSKVRTRAEIIAATGMTPEQIAATKRTISIGEGKRFDERLSDMFSKFESALKARTTQIATRPTVSSILPMPQTGQPIARPVGTAKPPTVRVDANDMLKKMNTFYGTAIKDIQKSLRSIDNSLKGKFVNQ
jgi:Sec-independent protein translocase protein TatA